MNTLPEDIQDTIYKYKHQLEFDSVINELVNKTIINTRIGHRTYIADHIRINGIHQIVHNYLWGLDLNYAGCSHDGMLWIQRFNHDPNDNI